MSPPKSIAASFPCSGVRWPGNRRAPATLALAFVLTWLCPASALAHGSLAVGDFYTGMLHPFLHFETVLPIVALALWSGQLADARAWHLPLVFLGAALVGAVAGMLSIEPCVGRWFLLLPMLVLGLLVAVRGSLPVWLAIVMVLLFGVGQGQANTYDPGREIERPLLFLAGFGSAIGLVLFHVATRVFRYRAFWVQTAVRVLGSWIAATGLLVLVLEWAEKQ
jgi:hydrogenase/urease accessory protein HupE